MINVEKLFINENISNIKSFERKTDREVHEKKEELKILVGEKYSNIIDAADSINKMKEVSTKVKSDISSILNLLSEDRIQMQEKKTSVENHSLEIGCYVKFLIILPEKTLWFLNDERYYCAAVTYKYCEYVFSTLVDPVLPFRCEIDSTFPFVYSRWHAVKNIDKIILRDCCTKYRTGVDVEMFADILSAVILLSPTKSFSECLKILWDERSGHILRSDKDKISRESISTAIEHTIQLLSTFATLLQDDAAYFKAFIERNNQKNVFHMLGLDIDFRRFLNVVPLSLKGFSVKVNPIDFHVNFKNWVDVFVSELESALEVQLSFLGSVKAISRCQAAVINSIHQLEETDVVENISKYIGRPFNVWKDILKSLFRKKFSNLLQARGNEMWDLIKPSLMDTSNASFEQEMQFEDSFCDYLWPDVEMHHDFTAEAVIEKSSGLTPITLGLISQIDDLLKTFYVEINEQCHAVKCSEEWSNFVDGVILQTFKDFILRIKDELHAKATHFSRILSQDITSRHIQEVIFFAKFSSSFFGKSTELNRISCLMDFTDIQSQFERLSHEFFSVWRRYLISVSMELITTGISTEEFIAQPLLHSIWEDEDVEEENEIGERVKSTISLPSKPSNFLYEALWILSKMINKAGGCTLPSNLFSDINTELVAHIFDCYSGFIKTVDSLDGESNQCQNLALQLVFDLKFIIAVFIKDAEKDFYVKTISKFEEFVDPFDYAVFHPCLIRRIAAAVSQSSLIFITSVLKAGNTTSHSLSNAQNFLHLIDSSKIRFHQLPLPSSLAFGINSKTTDDALFLAENSTFSELKDSKIDPKNKDSYFKLSNWFSN